MLEPSDNDQPSLFSPSRQYFLVKENILQAETFCGILNVKHSRLLLMIAVSSWKRILQNYMNYWKQTRLFQIIRYDFWKEAYNFSVIYDLKKLFNKGQKAKPQNLWLEEKKF